MSDDHFALENLQEKKWFILSKNGDNFVQSSVEENQIIFDTIENLLLHQSILNLYWYH